MSSAAPAPSSRDLLLDAAERLFAEQGFARTTIKQIGRAAGVNSALLYYYFADKRELYREVLHRFVARLVARTMGASAGDDPEAGIRAFVAAQADTIALHPHAPRLFVRELVDADPGAAVDQVRLLAATSFRRLCALIEEGQRAGLFRRDASAPFAAISTVAQLAYFSIARPAVALLLGTQRDGVSAATARDFARHAADFALAALAARPASRARPSARPAARARRRAR